MVWLATQCWLPLLLLALVHGEQVSTATAVCNTEWCEESVLLQLPASDHDKVSLSVANAAPAKATGQNASNATASNATSVQHSSKVSRSAGDMLLPFLGASALTAGVIVFLYWSKGARVILQVLVYVACLSTIRFSVKLVQDTNHFRFPLFLTMTHFLTSALIAFFCAQVWQDSMHWPTLQEWTTRFVPIACAHATSVAVSNMALMHANASFVEVVTATTPVVAVGVVLLFGQAFDRRLLLPVSVIVVGCIVSSKGDVAFSSLGFVLAFSGNIFRAIKATIQQMMLSKSPDGKAAFTPLEVLAWTCLPCSLIMCVWSLIAEGMAPAKMLATPTTSLIGTMAVSGLIACSLNLAVLFVIKELGAVGTQLIGQAKTLLVVLGSMALFGEKVTAFEGIGFILVMGGVWGYNYMEAKPDKAVASAPPKGETGAAPDGEKSGPGIPSDTMVANNNENNDIHYEGYEARQRAAA